MASDNPGLRIRRARERRGWTQQDLADALTHQRGRKVGLRSVGRWERCEAVPRNAIGALEYVLGVDLTSKAAPEFTPDLADPAEAALWAMHQPPEWRRKVIEDLRLGRAQTGS